MTSFTTTMSLVEGGTKYVVWKDKHAWLN